jgi:hypothetical protein
MMKSRFLVVLSYALILAGCNAKYDDSALRSESAVLAATVATLQTQYAELEKRVAAVESSYAGIINYDEASFAYLQQPNDPRWVTGRTSFGKFAVSVQSLTPKGAGTTVVLSVINLSSAAIASASFEVNYNEYTFKEGLALLSEGKTLNTRDAILYKTEKTFPAGVWVRQELVLPELPPEKIKFMSVKFDGTSLQAGGPY